MGHEKKDYSRHLERISIIERANYLWWDIGYKIDPREYMEFEDFEKRLAGISGCDDSRPARDEHRHRKPDFMVYKGEKVPVSILDVNIDGYNIPLFISARPLTPKEFLSAPFPRNFSGLSGCFENKNLTQVELERAVIENAASGWPLESNYLPHVRGFVMKFDNETLIYYPLKITQTKSGEDYSQKIRQALDGKGKWFIREGTEGSSFQFISDRIRKIESHLITGKLVLFKKTRRGHKVLAVPFTEEGKKVRRVPYDEMTSGNRNLLSYYPVRCNLPGSVPAAICSYGEKLCTPGLFDETERMRNGEPDERLFVIPYISRDFAFHVSKEIKNKTGMECEPLLYERNAGSPAFLQIGHRS